MHVNAQAPVVRDRLIANGLPRLDACHCAVENRAYRTLVSMHVNAQAAVVRDRLIANGLPRLDACHCAVENRDYRT